MIKKYFKIQFSGKLPNNTIGSFEFGTEQSTDSELVDGDTNGEKLFEKVYKSTLADIKKAMKENPAIEIIWKEFMSGLSQARKFQEASTENGDKDN